MNHRSTRLASFAGVLAIAASTLVASPALASCIALESRLPDPASPGAVVFQGTVIAGDATGTQLHVDGWYLGAAPGEVAVVTGGRVAGPSDDPQVITSVDWNPVPGEEYVVVATRAEDGSLSTDVCEQQWPTPELVAALVARYGEPVAPAPTSSLSPSPAGSGDPLPSASTGPS